MAQGLRYEAGRDLPLGMQELLAKHYLGQKVTEALTQENAVLLAVLKELDQNCLFCANASNSIVYPCADMNIDDAIAIGGCKKCPHTNCVCNSCENHSKYNWCGAEEALCRLAQIQESETEGRE